MERIQIQNFKGLVLMNRRSEMGGEDAVPEVGRRVSWVAPASTSNPTGYPGDLKFLGRCGDIYSN